MVFIELKVIEKQYSETQQGASTTALTHTQALPLVSMGLYTTTTLQPHFSSVSKNEPAPKSCMCTVIVYILFSVCHLNTDPTEPSPKEFAILLRRQVGNMHKVN